MCLEPKGIHVKGSPWTTLVIALAVALGGCLDSSPGDGQPDTTVPGTGPTGSSLVGSVDVEPIRLIHPDEWTVVMSKCISDEGWPVEVSPDGGIMFLPVPADQGAEKQAAQERCSQWYPVDPRYRQPLTDEQLEILYRWRVDVAIPCLEDRGFTGFSPPTLERYIETYLTQDHWAPYGDIDSQLTQRHDEWYQVNEECPQTPGVAALFGEE